MNRRELLEAVVQTVRWLPPDHRSPAMEAALAALDALPANPAPAEVVEVRAGVIFWGGTDYMVRGSAIWADDADIHSWAARHGQPLAAIITARVPLPTLPMIAGTTRLPLVKGDGA